MHETTDRWNWATSICLEAARRTLAWFDGRDLSVEMKFDRSPVTEADRAAEQFLRERIADRFPGDGILGEEFGEQSGTTEYRWILDPIDGTTSFVRGVPLFGTMVGVERAGQPLIGVLAFPGLDESISAMSGQGAWHRRGASPPRQARVSRCGELSSAVVVTSDAASFAKRQADQAWRQIETDSLFTRTWGDAYGYLLVATGRVEGMIDPVLQTWDAAAVMPVILEAGGMFTDWQGQPRIDSGDAIGSNGFIHADILQRLQQR